MGFLHMRNLANARAAPGGPEIQHHDLALERTRKLHRVAVHRLCCKRKRWLTNRQVRRKWQLFDRFCGRFELQFAILQFEHITRACEVERLANSSHLEASADFLVAIAINRQTTFVVNGPIDESGQHLAIEFKRVLRAKIRIVHQCVLELSPSFICGVEAIHSQPTGLLFIQLNLSTSEMRFEFTLLASFPFGGRIIRQIAVAIGVDKQASIAFFRLIDRKRPFLFADLNPSKRRCCQVFGRLRHNGCFLIHLAANRTITTDTLSHPFTQKCLLNLARRQQFCSGQ